MQGKYYNTQLIGTFDRYKLNQFIFSNAERVGYDANVVLKDVVDKTTGEHYEQIQVPLSKAFASLGQITDHPRFLMDARHYLEDQGQPERCNFGFITNIKEITDRHAWPNDKMERIKAVMRFNHEHNIEDFYSPEFLEH